MCWSMDISEQRVQITASSPLAVSEVSIMVVCEVS